MTPAQAATARPQKPKRYVPWATLALIAANVAVFVVMGVRTNLSALLGNPVGGIVQPGGLTATQVWLDHQWWRIFSSMFIHAGLLHIGANMWALWNVGSFTERLFGRPYMVFAYLVTGVAGASMSMLAHPSSLPSVGASGAIFGLFGLICGFALRARHLIAPEAYQSLRTGILLSLGLNVVLSVAIPFIDVAAHLGGLLAGTGAGLLATGSAIERADKRPAFSSQLIVLASVAALLVLSRTHTVHSAEGKSYERNRLARQAFDAEKWDEVVAAATHALSQKDDRLTRMMRAEAYAHLGRWAEALADYQAAQELTSLDSLELPNILERKANAEVHVGKTDEAKSDLARAVDLAGQEAEWLDLHGQLSVVRGDYELAVLELRAAHKRMPEDPSPANSLAWALVMTQGDMDEALAAANVAVDKAKGPVKLTNPGIMAASLGTRCWVHALREDKDRAMADCQAAIESGSTFVDQGMLAYLKGDYKEAVQQWQHAGEDNPLEEREMKPWIERAKSKL